MMHHLRNCFSPLVVLVVVASALLLNSLETTSAFSQSSVTTTAKKKNNNPTLMNPRIGKVFPLHASSASATSTSATGGFTTTTTTGVNNDDGVDSAATTTTTNELKEWQSKLVRAGMITFIASMCIALPATLLPQRMLYKLGLISKTQKEMLGVRTSQFCARFLLRLIPFCKMDVIPGIITDGPAQPAIWVCNHTSMLDIFLLLAADKKLRRDQRRPIKIVYWKELESNPVTKLLFKQSGFIPVQMADNGHGTANEYDISSFKRLLRDCKKAFKEGFDVGLLPEGQLNPTTEDGVLPPFAGAFNLAKMSRRPIRYMALYGIDKLWHPTRGMICTGRNVVIRCYSGESFFKSPGQFVAAFTNIVGYFGQKGEDLPDDELKLWMAGHQVSHDSEPKENDSDNEKGSDNSTD